MSFSFAAPRREAVLTSLVQAWKSCGHMLHAASGGSEWGKFPREWSDVDQFWKDLVTAVNYAGKMTVDGESSHALLRSWQVLDPFVAAVFIDKRITALQKQKTIVAVDSSTRVVDDGSSRASGASCNGHQNVQYCPSQETHVRTELCGTQNMDSEVVSRTENRFQSNREPEEINCGENIGRNLVKRVRKKSRWLSDFESTGLNGLYARSFTQSTIGLNGAISSSIGSSSVSKKHVKAKNEPAKLSAENRDMSPEAQSQERSAIKTKSESWEQHAKKRLSSEIDFNDDDLLITVIVKNRDMGSFHKSTSQSMSSKDKFRMLKSSKKGNKLLIQTARKGDSNVLDGRQIILARKTVLCWLIATGFMTLKDVVQCRNAKNNKVLKDGWVTWDGILCSCCIKTLSMSDFKAHVDSSIPKSSLNLYLQSGKSLTLCQLEAWTAEYMYRQSNDCNINVEAQAVDENDDTCGICGDGGQLLCCDNCPSTYHQACLSTEELPDDSWYCHYCICQSCGCPVSEKEISSFSAILKCLQCGVAYHDTCVDMGAKAFEDIDSAGWFCGRYCKEIYLGLHGRVGVENSLGGDLSWTVLRCNSGGQKLRSLQKIAHVVECNSKLAVALNLYEECFIRMVDTRTGIDMIPHVLYNQGSKYARLDYQGFYTVILEKGEEILCAASIRVHGTKAAEIPFMATCREHRRQGMCRKLINTIEEMLRSFHVKLLVLSAIPELVSTWVSGFGFKPIEEDERKQLDTVNLMLFPGTSLLTKKLEDGSGTY